MGRGSAALVHTIFMMALDSSLMLKVRVSSLPSMRISRKRLITMGKPRLAIMGASSSTGYHLLGVKVAGGRRSLPPTGLEFVDDFDLARDHFGPDLFDQAAA